tara:strand:- start:1575 stop:2783 length:1209 start_codon:yes stop_codon:yes gene_type:complete
MDSSRDDFVIAIRSAFLKKGNKQKFSLLSLILFSIFFLVLGNFNFKIIKFNRTIIKEIIYYSSTIVSLPENIIKNSFNKVSDHFYHYDDYTKIKSNLRELKNKNLEKEIITFENIELKKLIDDYFVEDRQAYAKVLIDKQSPFLRSIVINKGSKNGVKAGMAVYDDIYLVGKIVEVNFLTSRVLLISDINSKIPITIQPTNLQGIMSGLDQKKGQLQYINKEKLINDNIETLLVVTSGIGGIFRSGIPIGEINLADALENNKLVVNFYRNFTQLKYVKISSHRKENNNTDNPEKKKSQERYDQVQNIKILKKQKIINDEIKIILQSENIKLKKDLNDAQNEIRKKNKELSKNREKSENLKFLELNLLHGHKCKKSLFRSHLYKVGSDEYRACILNEGPIKKN